MSECDGDAADAALPSQVAAVDIADEAAPAPSPATPEGEGQKKAITVELHTADTGGKTNAAKQEAEATAAEGQAQWLLAFWAPTLKKKHPEVQVTVVGRSTIRVAGELGSDGDEAWPKLIATALKKADVDDLGEMDAAALLASIPETDGNGRGLQDLRAMEKDLGVKVVFCANKHVLLVGPKAKLQKKCFALRNLLSHYHWRLSGRDVAFETMTATR